MEHVSIRRTSTEDIEHLRQLGQETFVETFAQSNTAADMKKYLDENFRPEKVSEELNNPDSRFFIAWEGKTPIGYLKLNTGKAQTELQDDTAIEIERIYVLSAYHGKKIGQLLYEKALEVALDQRKSFIWLGVWENNLKAIRFYEKNGFVAFDKHIFKLGEDEQIDIMMKKVLK
ncbi:GNAT family N-acetyltransferase [Chitinophaga filiformis]|uniref:Ribosomal protein S18 acetylase RimI n=1 Tax=Chitinophaga filiformis TaxID=104663 RepID=A0A1G8C5C4_CHIFI|nr:GNAT family N-acetyltransferase [Chitinophaga filiformis]SDH40592.1 Ribosomal protein S18 acetylase RimI [Chitinophaga filiformis]